MSAIVTDQFRILNANNFIKDIEEGDNSYYVFLSLPNPQPASIGFGREDSWDTNIPNPTDNTNYETFYKSTSIFGKRITSLNVRRLIRRVDWVRGNKYEMYRHDYSVTNPSPITQSARLYDSNYYVINSDYRVYICIDNGSSEVNPTGNESQDEPTFTDLEPSRAGISGDGYVWKYLFTVSPSDIIKFDSIEYITVPNNWEKSTDPQIVSVRENGDSRVNNNQIKKVYIDKRGRGYPLYSKQPFDIVGDGQGGRVVVDTDSSGRITDVQVISGGKNYTYGLVDLQTSTTNTPSVFAKLIPIIPPSNGHGFNLYKELGTDKILIYARFDDSTKDFPIDTKFSQIGIVKNPTIFGSNEVFKENSYSALYSIKLTGTIVGDVSVGEKISQVVPDGIAFGYVASFDKETNVLKYYKDRSLNYNPNSPYDQTDYIGLSITGKSLNFQPISNSITTDNGFNASIDTSFTGSTIVIGDKTIYLGVSFVNGLSNPEINKESGDILYIDNRPSIERNLRQKEDIKIILEF